MSPKVVEEEEVAGVELRRRREEKGKWRRSGEEKWRRRERRSGGVNERREGEKRGRRGAPTGFKIRIPPNNSVAHGLDMRHKIYSPIFLIL